MIRTIICKDCGTTVETEHNFAKRCKPCALLAKRQAKRDWEARPMPCECGRGFKTSKNEGCAACNAAYEAAHHIERRAPTITDKFNDWIMYAETWRRDYYLARRAIVKAGGALTP
jgi:hypothetical protein